MSRGKIGKAIVIVAMAFLLGACGSVRYYAQAVRGQGSLILHRRALDTLIDDPRTDPALADRLRHAQQARRFASRRLGLPDNRSYTRYVGLDRPYVVWNVFATPRHSVEAEPQCFPIAGCVAYRGWFREAAAQADAAKWRARGDDVWVGGVPAYSTLGWFADPILSSMLRWDEDELDGTIFHELAHQLIYVKGDTAFNESFASFVQDEGLRQWRQSRGLPPPDPSGRLMSEDFTRQVLALRESLRALYDSGVDEAAMEQGKQQRIAAFREDYARWRDHCWPGDHRYDGWMAQPINNARLLPFGLYDQWQGAFAVMFHQAKASWPLFYQRVRELAGQPAAARGQALRRLAGTPVALDQGVDLRPAMCRR